MKAPIIAESSSCVLLGWIESRSSWPIDPTFVPFLDLALQAARPQDSTPLSFKPGETTVIQAPAGRSPRAAILRDARRQLQRATIQHGRAQLRLPGTPGLYELAFDDRPEVERIFSVNPDAKESELEFVDSPQAMKGWCFDPSDKTSPVVSAPSTTVGFSGILQQRLWWWMVLGGLLALALETAWAERKGEAA